MGGSCCFAVSIVRRCGKLNVAMIWEQTGPPRLQLIRRTKLHLGAHHETGEDKVETIELVCFDQVNEGRLDALFSSPPMHTFRSLKARYAAHAGRIFSGEDVTLRVPPINHTS